MVRALEQLYALDALDDKGELTPLGKKMAEFPLEPIYAKILFQSKVFLFLIQNYNCICEIIDLISMLSVESIFYSPHEKRDEAGEMRKKFASQEGDHLTLLNVLDASQTHKADLFEWCRDNFINWRNLKQALVLIKLTIENQRADTEDLSAGRHRHSDIITTEPPGKCP